MFLLFSDACVDHHFSFLAGLILHYEQRCNVAINRSSIPTGSTFFASFSFVVNAVMHWCAISARRSAAVAVGHHARTFILYMTHFSRCCDAVLWAVPARKWSETHHQTIFWFDSFVVRLPVAAAMSPHAFVSANWIELLFVSLSIRFICISFHLRFPPFVYIKMLFSTWNIFVIERIKRNLDKVPHHIWVCHLNGYCCGGGSDGGSNKKSNVAHDRRESALLVHRTFGTRNETKKKCKMFSDFSVFNFRCGVSTQRGISMFYWRIYFLILSDCRRYVKNALFKFFFRFSVSTYWLSVVSTVTFPVHTSRRLSQCSAD